MANSDCVVLTRTVDRKKYEDAKKKLAEELKGNLKVKYPTSLNSLSEKFLGDYFAPYLDFDDLCWFVEVRNYFRSKAKAGDGVKAEVENWFPAFRSVVGKTFFPEFSKDSSDSKKDNMGDKLAELIKMRRAEMEGGDI